MFLLQDAMICAPTRLGGRCRLHDTHGQLSVRADVAERGGHVGHIDGFHAVPVAVAVADRQLGFGAVEVILMKHERSWEEVTQHAGQGSFS